MACLHKFFDYLELQKGYLNSEVDHLDFKPTTLIVGTFNPSWPTNNKAEWFYGRTHDENGNQNNNFWDVLPRIYGNRSLIENSFKEWKKFCCYNKIALTDFIYSIEDAEIENAEHEKYLKTYSDRNISTKFKNHKILNVVKLLQQNSSIKNIYFTRGANEIFWRKLWEPVSKYAKQNDLHHQTLITPSGYAFYQQARYNNQNFSNQIKKLSDFILFKWQQRWHKI